MFRLVRADSRGPGSRRLALPAFLAVATLWLALGWEILPSSLLPSCPLRRYTGIPCPFCGLTRAAVFLARGDWPAAWRSNVLSPLLPAGLGALAVAAALELAGYRLAGAGTGSRRRLFWAMAAALALLSWAVNLRRF